MKKILRATPIAMALTFLVVLLVGVSPNKTLVGSGSASAGPIIAEDAIYDVSTTFSTSDIAYSADGSTASYNVSSVAGTLNTVYYNSSEVPQEIQNSANQMIYDINSGAVSGVVNVDMGYAYSEADYYQQTYSYVPVEFTGTYDTSGYDQYQQDKQIERQQMELQTKTLPGPRRKYDRNLLVASLNPARALAGMNLAMEPAERKSGVKVEFKVKGSVERNRTPGRSSMVFNGEENGSNGNGFRMRNSKFESPGVGFGGADFKVKDWGTSPKDSIKSTMKKHELQMDVESVQMDAATGTMSVKQRASLKRQKN